MTGRPAPPAGEIRFMHRAVHTSHQQIDGSLLGRCETLFCVGVPGIRRPYGLEFDK